MLSYNPPVKPAERRTEICSNLDYRPVILLPRKGVGLVVDLLKCFFGGTVIFQLQYIDILVGLQKQVYAAVAGLVLGFNVQAAKACDYENHVLKPVLSVFCNLVELRSGKEGLETLHKTFGIAAFDILHEFSDFKRGAGFICGSVINSSLKIQ